MKRYIDFNNEKRSKATSSFEKEFFKLMNNSTFGKCMENVKKRSKMVLTPRKVLEVIEKTIIPYRLLASIYKIYAGDFSLKNN